jgi:hypothetical protein
MQLQIQTFPSLYRFPAQKKTNGAAAPHVLGQFARPSAKKPSFSTAQVKTTFRIP